MRGSGRHHEFMKKISVEIAQQIDMISAVDQGCCDARQGKSVHRASRFYTHLAVTGGKMVRAFHLIAFALVALLISSSSFATVGPFTYFDVPGAGATNPTAVSGATIVGSFNDGATHAFIYNGTTYTTLDAPDPGSFDTVAFGIRGNTVVGGFRDAGGFEHGFLYNLLSSTWTQYDAPGGVETTVTGVSAGGKICGIYDHFGAGDGHGFTYDGVTFATVDDPADPHNLLHAISADGSIVIGTHDPNTGQFEQGFSYNGSSFTELSFPGADRTSTYGISGNLIVGGFGDSGFTVSHGFVYNGSAWTQVDDPNHPDATALTGIDGSTAVGTYFDENGHTHGLMTTVPEPASLAGFMIAAALVVRKRKA